MADLSEYTGIRIGDHVEARFTSPARDNQGTVVGMGSYRHGVYITIEDANGNTFTHDSHGVQRIN